MSKLYAYLKYAGLVFAIPFSTCLYWYFGNGFLALWVFSFLTVAVMLVWFIRPNTSWPGHALIGAAGMVMITPTLTKNEMMAVLRIGSVICFLVYTLYVVEQWKDIGKTRYDRS